MEIIFVIWLVIVSCAIIAWIMEPKSKFSGYIDPFQARSNVEAQKIMEWNHRNDDSMLECWSCPSCSQYNRTNAPFYHFQVLRCQNCYEPKPEKVEYTAITMALYWQQARFSIEYQRRKAVEAKKPLWIDPSIAKGKTHTIDFDPPTKQMPDDLKDKISRN